MGDGGSLIRSALRRLIVPLVLHNERGKLSKDFVAAGDGLVAFGAALILPVQTH
jgi:hypothetical protein